MKKRKKMNIGEIIAVRGCTLKKYSPIYTQSVKIYFDLMMIKLLMDPSKSPKKQDKLLKLKLLLFKLIEEKKIQVVYSMHTVKELANPWLKAVMEGRKEDLPSLLTFLNREIRFLDKLTLGVAVKDDNAPKGQYKLIGGWMPSQMLAAYKSNVETAIEEYKDGQVEIERLKRSLQSDKYINQFMGWQPDQVFEALKDIALKEFEKDEWTNPVLMGSKLLGSGYRIDKHNLENDIYDILHMHWGFIAQIYSTEERKHKVLFDLYRRLIELVVKRPVTSQLMDIDDLLNKLSELDAQNE